MQLFTKRNLSIIFTDLVVWIVAMAIFVVLRFSPVFSGPEIVVPKSEIEFKYYLNFGLQIGVFLGIVYGLVDIFLDQNWLRKRSYGAILIIKGIIHFVVLILISILIRVEAFDQFDIELTRENLRNSLINPGLIIIFGYTTMVSFVLNFFRQINLKFGPGNLWKFITGRFHRPKEEERIFMFLDMKGSTTIAESLGHVQFGELVQDCFSDLSVVRNNEAEVYQYVGDEAILYWEVENGLRNNNCLLAFFEYNRLLKNKSEYYQKTYGVIPEFKAGANIGAVTVTEVGDIKRDLAFLGDTMNTAARIESECNKHNTNLLISEMLHQRLPAADGLIRTLVDQLTLRGKKQAIGVYSVAQQD
jgi:adenylate cyclase